MAARLVNSRLRDEMGLFFDVSHRSDIPRRTDLGDLPNYRTHKHTLYGRQEGLCAGCRVMFPFRNTTVDHVVPQSRGGSDHIDNLQLLCGACNSMKGTDSKRHSSPGSSNRDYDSNSIGLASVSGSVKSPMNGILRCPLK